MALKSIQPPPLRDMPVLSDRVGTPHEGAIFTLNWSGFFRKLVDALNSNLAAGYTGTVPLAALTSGGTQGSLTVTNGIITAVVKPT
jgi:hypothetical protein